MDVYDEEDWFLREWMDHCGKRQADLIRDLDWLRGRASKVFNSRQPYTRDDVNTLSRWLGIRPFELLMPPQLAIALRRLRRTAEDIVGNPAMQESSAQPRARSRPSEDSR